MVEETFASAKLISINTNKYVISEKKFPKHKRNRMNDILKWL